MKAPSSNLQINHIRCDPSFGNLCDSMQCRSCPYCQVYGKILCGGCGQCSRAWGPSVTRISATTLAFWFKNALIVDKSRDLASTFFYVRDTILLAALRKHYSTEDSTELMDSRRLGEILDESSRFFQKKTKQQFIYYTSKPVEKINVLGKSILVSYIDKDINTTEITESFQAEKPRANEKKQPLPSQSDLECTAKAYVVTVSVDDVKLGIDGVLEEDFTLMVIYEPQCLDESANATKLLTQMSVSLCGLLASNYLQEVLFSLLNSRDMLDLVRYHGVDRESRYYRFAEFFETFECTHFAAFYSAEDAWRSNTAIRSFLLGDYMNSKYWSHSFSQKDNYLRELRRQLSTRLPTGVLEMLKCQHRLILPEYIMLVCLGILCLAFCLLKIVFHCQSPGKNFQCWSMFKRVYGIIYETFLGSVLLIYFYNLVMFCAILKNVKTVFFGAVDFGVIIVRGALVVFPIFNLTQNILKPINPKPVKKPHKTRAAKSSPAQHTIIRKSRHRTVYGTWMRRANSVKVFVRLSFARPHRPSGKKRIWKRYRFKIAQNKSRSRLKSTQNRFITRATRKREIQTLRLIIYAKNVLLHLFLFGSHTESVQTMCLVAYLQLLVMLILVARFASANRKTWVPLSQEVFLAYFYCMFVYVKYAESDKPTDSCFAMLYFMGLSLSVLGLLFEIVEDKKHVWIPKLAWPSIYKAH